MFINDALNQQKLDTDVEVVVEGFDRYAECCFGRSAADAPEIDGKIFFTTTRKLTAGDDILDCDLLGSVNE